MSFTARRDKFTVNLFCSRENEPAILYLFQEGDTKLEKINLTAK